MSFGPNPWQQTSWDARAAGNFIGGGAGAGLIVFAALSGAQGPALTGLMLAGLALVGAGLFCVFAGARPAVARDQRPLQSAHVVDVARSVHRGAALSRRARRCRGRLLVHSDRRGARGGFRLLPGPDAAGGQGHSGVARAAPRAAARGDGVDRRRRRVPPDRAAARCGNGIADGGVRCVRDRARARLVRVSSAGRRYARVTLRTPHSIAPDACCSSPERSLPLALIAVIGTGIIAGQQILAVAAAAGLAALLAGRISNSRW